MNGRGHYNAKRHDTNDETIMIMAKVVMGF